MQVSVSRATGVVVRAERASWLPGSELPSYLNGTPRLLPYSPRSPLFQPRFHCSCQVLNSPSDKRAVLESCDVGELPGDFGFDPLRLGENKEALEWYQQAEIQNGRHVLASLCQPKPLLVGLLECLQQQVH